jgi:rhodanese-related sulfurtransferase
VEVKMKALSFLATGSLVALLLFGFGAQPSYAAHDTEDKVNTLTPERIKYYLDNEEKLILIDLRPAKEFQQKRLPGARSIPIKELPKRLREIPHTGRVILYCDCPQNELIQDAYQVLADDHGYLNISVMPEGFKGWLKRKFPVEAGSKTN